jgi:murein DD-endopeptidase MepM/ murein hydrolase activator NlpD
MKKRERYISLIIAPHHKAQPWQMDISYTNLKRIAVLLSVLLLVAVFFVFNYGHIFWRASQYEIMKKRTREVEEKFSEIQALKSELSALKRTEAKLQHMLGISQQPVLLSLDDITRNTSLNASVSGDPALLSNSEDTLSVSLERSTPSIMPVKGWVSAKMGDHHNGVDIAAREGAPVVSAADGIVTFAGWDNYFGNKVEVAHGQKFSTMYGHNAKLFVKEKQAVKQGQVIALVGSTGQSSGPHLHYEVRINGKPVDPSYHWINH